MVMEPNGLQGGMYSSLGAGMLGLEMSLHHHPQHQTPQNPNLLQQNPHPQIVAFSHHEADHSSQAHQPMKQTYPQQPSKLKPQQLTLSDEDDPAGEDSVGGDGKKKSSSPWQRMKWTDGMVKLLIMAVFYIGDEACSEGGAPDPGGKKKGNGVLQKKGKWKSVSRAMMERGFFVSPQQCEDKFNDLNKRYKRVNDILGKGTACKVVENQSLLDTMDHLSPKMKEEVKKLLNSKHLFFREMCAYHNSCGGGSGSGANGVPAAPHSSELEAERSHLQQQHQMCHHASENPPIVPNPSMIGMEGSRLAKGRNNEDYDNDDEDDEDDDEEELGYDNGGSGMRSNENGHKDDEGSDEKCSRKRQRKGHLTSNSPLIQQLCSELVSMAEDVTRTYMEKRQWIKNRQMQLEEQRVSHQLEAYEMEKQRLKWIKFSSKKEREMEREKLKNERVKLENERMLLLLRQKEFELLCSSIQQQQTQLPPN